MLVKKLSRGDKRAFNTIFSLYNIKIFSFVFSYLKNKEDAEELIQEVFLTLWEKKDTLDPNRSIKNFLFTIAINKTYNYLHHKSIEEQYKQSNFVRAKHILTNMYDEIIFKDLENEYLKIIQQLPPQRQKIYEMSRLKHIPHRKIAQELSISIRTVENQIHKALLFIKSKLKTELDIIK